MRRHAQRLTRQIAPLFALVRALVHAQWHLFNLNSLPLLVKQQTQCNASDEYSLFMHSHLMSVTVTIEHHVQSSLVQHDLGGC